jgi:serine/threonine protein kinase
MIPTGTRFGRYEIGSQLGARGMGEVYLAQDTKLDRKVALKILPAEVAANRERMRRFTQEAKAAAAFNHPNIAHVYEIDEVDGQHFIAMEYVDGETLLRLSVLLCETGQRHRFDSGLAAVEREQ